MASLSLPLFLSLLFFVNTVLSDHSPAHSPSLPPHPSPADDVSPPPTSPSSAPAPAPVTSFSPPAPPPSDLASKSPSPVPTPPEHSPSPAKSVAADINQPNAGDVDREEKSSGGMSSGQKAGVAIGVIAGACIVGAGALVYKKRQQNIQRSQYGYAARREIL